VLYGGVGRRGSRARAAGLNDGRATLGHLRNEGGLHPSLVDHRGRVLPADLGVEDIGVLGGRVVAPDRHLGDLADAHAELLGQHGLGAVVVEPGEGVEAFAGDIWRVAHRDQGIGVGRVAGDQDAHIVGGRLVEGPALCGEDGAVCAEQIAALHARLARHGADEHGEVRAVEDLLGIIADHHIGQVGERAVLQFHDHTFQRLQRGGDLEQAQLDRTVAQQ